MKPLILCLSLFVCLSISSCATKVSSIKEDGAVQLKQEEGFLLIALKSNINLKEISISGEKYIKLNIINYFLILLSFYIFITYI